MTLSNDLLSRVRKTWEMLKPVVPTVYGPPRRIDHLVKMNLPPLMGRRDAAFDKAAEIIAGDVFAGEERERNNVYTVLGTLLNSAADDTRAILATLSSPDTEAREKQMLSFLELLHDITRSLGDFTRLEHELFSEENTALREFAVSRTEAEIARSERTISEAEINIVNLMRAYFERSLPKVARYREYTGKSFSKAYASRYHKSYEVYSKLYSELSHAVPSNSDAEA